MTHANTVLIVDDVAENLHMLMECLKDDYAVLAAKNGSKALKIAGAMPQPDLILLDIVMPDMDGYEVCRRLKADERTRDIPVIFITALSEEADETKGLELGAIDYITKPFTPAVVRARVRNQIQLREMARLREDVERIMRHDLKAPLNGIMGLPQLLLMEGNLSPDQAQIARDIELLGRRMLRMVEMSLDLFKMETGAYLYEPREVDALAVVSEILQDIGAMMTSRRVQCHCEVDGAAAAGPFHVLAGEQLLYSMLSHLIVNAVEASPAGARVTVRMTKQPAPCISIHNHGVVPAAIRPFFFLKYKTFGKTKGTGLGTYTAKLIADTMGCELQLETSDEEDSTSISILFPAVAPSVARP